MANLTRFTVTCNKVNAEIYVVNMIVGSYFNGTNSLKKYRVDYSLLTRSKQEKLEEKVIDKMELLDQDKLNNMKDLRYTLRIKVVGDKTILLFETGFEEIVCFIDGKGNLIDLRLVEEFSREDVEAYITEILTKSRKKNENMIKRNNER